MSLTSPSGQRLLAYMPPFLAASRILQSVLQHGGTELDAAGGGIADILAQHFAQTVTWAIDLWEDELGFISDPAQTTAERRSRVLGRLRGYGTVTVKLLKQIAEAWDKGRTAVIPDYAAAVMVIRFIDTTGVPSNLSDLQAELRKVLPAHWDLQFEYNYLLWDELNVLAWTWDQIDGVEPGGPVGAPLTWDDLEVYG